MKWEEAMGFRGGRKAESTESENTDSADRLPDAHTESFLCHKAV